MILFSSTGQAVDVPRAVTAAIEQREFMAGFTGYDDYSLLDAYQWKEDFYCVIMLCPVGFHETFVFDCRDGRQEAVYRDVFIPKKDRRAEMRRKSILVRDAVGPAEAAMDAAAKAPGGREKFSYPSIFAYFLRQKIQTKNIYGQICMAGISYPCIKEITVKPKSDAEPSQPNNVCSRTRNLVKCQNGPATVIGTKPQSTSHWLLWRELGRRGSRMNESQETCRD